MKALKLIGVQQAEIREEPVPEPGPGQVRIKVERAGICGSDLGLFQAAPIPDE